MKTVRNGVVTLFWFLSMIVFIWLFYDFFKKEYGLGFLIAFGLTAVMSGMNTVQGVKKIYE